MKTIRAAAVQFEAQAGDKAANLATVRRFTARAAENRVQMITFPECCLTGYWFLRRLSRDQLMALAEPAPDGPSSQALLALADQYGMLIGAGLIERTAEGKLYNTYLAALPGGVWHRHRKLHAFVSPHLESGSEYTVFDTPFECRVGVLICYDNNLVENTRATALLGAEILLAPHQTGGCLSRSPHAMGHVDRALWDDRESNPRAIEAEFQGPKGRGWLMRWLPSRAHDNGMFLVFSNGVGVDDDEIRTGNAMILDPYGRILVETSKAGEDMVAADLDASLLPDSTGRRWLQARRPELYGLLTQPLGIERPIRAVRLGEE
ncbi:MAG: nitrilase family protein [bacterium]